MSMAKELKERYPFFPGMPVDDISDIQTQRNAYVAGRLREPTLDEIEAAARGVYSAFSHEMADVLQMTGISLEMNWVLLPESGKDKYRSYAQIILQNARKASIS